MVLGNLKDKTLDKLYSGEKISRLPTLNLHNKLDEIDLCKKCDAWKAHPNVWIKVKNRWF